MLKKLFEELNLTAKQQKEYRIVSVYYRNKKFSIEQVQEVNKENYILYLQTLDQQIPELN